MSEAAASFSAVVSNIRLEIETVNCIASVPADRWKGEYFNNTNLSGSPAMARDDGAGFLNLNFGSASPSSTCSLGADNFSARWTRTVNFAAGTYRFTAAVDNGVRLYVDGQLKIDQLGNLPPNTYTADVALTAGAQAMWSEDCCSAARASKRLTLRSKVYRLTVHVGGIVCL